MTIDTYSLVTTLVNSGLSYRKVGRLLRLGKSTIADIYTNKTFNPRPLSDRLSRFQQYLPKNTFIKKFNNIKYYLNTGDELYIREKGVVKDKIDGRKRQVTTTGDRIKVNKRTDLNKISRQTKDKAEDSHAGDTEFAEYLSSRQSLKVAKKKPRK